MFIRDPFDIAPRAPRHTPAAWALLVLCLGFCILAGVLLAGSWQDASAARAEAAAARALLLEQARKEAARAAEAGKEPAEGVRARLGLQRVLNVSWSGLFEVLEDATKSVDGRVTIAALAPVRLRPEGAEVGVTALAVSSDAMLQYLQATQADPRVRQVQLVAQQGATLNGASVIRFQVALLLRRPVQGDTPRTGGVKQALLGGAE